MLSNVDASCLQSTPAHLGVESEVAEARVSGKSSIFIHHEMLEVVPNCDCVLAWSNKVSSSSCEEGGEGTGHVALCVELIDGSSSNRWPLYYWGRGGRSL